MLTIPGKIFTVFLIVGASLGFKALLDRVWSREKRSQHNNIIGWELGITGTTYAVMLGFMLYTVWNEMSAADLNVTQEANAITDIHRLAESVPSPQREQLKTAAKTYVHSVIEEDWPAMSRGELDDLKSHINNRDIWRVLATVKPETPAQLMALDHSFYEVSALAEHRRVRYLQCESRMPVVLWWILIFGCVVTIASCCLFGSSETWLHSIQVLCFSLLVAVILTAIADIDEPFKGSVRIDDHAFRRAIQNMDEQ